MDALFVFVVLLSKFQFSSLEAVQLFEAKMSGNSRLCATKYAAEHDARKGS